MSNTESMIQDIMRPKFNLIELNEYKKYENKNFLILKKQNSIVVIDNRYDPPQIHSNLVNAFQKIKGKSSST